MEYNILEGWLALAAETRRIDKLSSSLGLDSPALQNSPSSLGSSCGSSGLNTPSQNAFRFLPLLHDFAPELLQTSPRKTASSSSQSPQSPRKRNIPLQENDHHRTQLDYARSSPELTRSSGVASYQWHSEEQQNYSFPIQSGGPNPAPVRPSIQTNRHMSYPAWPPPKPAPLYTDIDHRFRFDDEQRHYNSNSAEEEGSSTITTFTTLASPFSPRDPNRDTNMFGEIVHSRRSPNMANSRGIRVNDSLSPMLSEPFHRLIVKDEEEPIHLSGFSRRRLSDGDGINEMKVVMEENEDNGELSNWWTDDPSQRDLTFEFEMPSSASMYQS